MSVVCEFVDETEGPTPRAALGSLKLMCSQRSSVCLILRWATPGAGVRNPFHGISEFIRID